MSIKCEIDLRKDIYQNVMHFTCVVSNKSIKSDSLNLDIKNGEKPTKLCFYNCKMKKIPSSKDVLQYIPYIQSLQMIKCGLTEISKENLEGFEMLKSLDLSFNEITGLPGDLFKLTPRLEIISFFYNKIRFIGKGILSPLQNLYVFDLQSNPQFDTTYIDPKASVPSKNSSNKQVELYPVFTESMTLQEFISYIELKSELETMQRITNLEEEGIKMEQQLSEMKVVISEELKDQVANLEAKSVDVSKDLSSKCHEMKTSNDRLSALLRTQEVKINDLTLKNETLNTKLNEQSDLFLNLMNNSEAQVTKSVTATVNEFNKQIENLENEIEVLRKETKCGCSNMLVVKIITQSFSVHKHMLSNQSDVLKHILETEPDLEEIVLNDISPVTFKQILGFIYTGLPPDNDSDWISLYGASNKLKMDTLIAITSEMLKNAVYVNNAYDILLLANRFNDDELRKRAFEEFRKNFPNQVLNPEIASQPEKLRTIMEMKKNMERNIADLQT